MAEIRLVGYEFRLISGALRRCPKFVEIEVEKSLWCLYGRMGLDSDYYCLKSNVEEDSLSYWISYYKETWRHVEIRREA